MRRNGGESGRRALELLLEVLLISLGVFLGLLASNWHEAREHRANARAALRNFLDEIQLNRGAIERNRSYHETLARQLTEFLSSSEPMTESRFHEVVDFKGLRPVIFEHTAWDLALATQSLSYLQPRLAFDISKIYTKQDAFQKLENSFLASAYTPASFDSDSRKGMAVAMQTYMNDVNQLEPAMILLYGKTIPEVRMALKQSSSHQVDLVKGKRSE